MHYMREVMQAIGMFWCITILGAVVVVGTGFGLYEAGWILAAHNVHHQAVLNNAQYQATRQTQAYQDTFVQETDQAFQQLKADMWNTAQAAQNGDQTMVTEGNAEIASDQEIFCKDAQKLTPTSLDSLGPSELRFYQQHC